MRRLACIAALGLLACAAPAPAPRLELPRAACMRADGRCPRDRAPPSSDLERDLASTRSGEGRAALCHDERARLDRATRALSRECETDADCVVVGAWYCGVPARRGDHRALEERWDAYRGSCQRMELECAVTRPTCVARTCTWAPGARG